MSSLSQLLAIKALDGLHMRAIATAENIANSGSLSFRPKSVDFEAELQRALTKGVDAIKDYQPGIAESPVAIEGGDVRLDLEMATASETALRYAALTDVLNRQMQLSHLAVKGQ